MKYRVVTIPRHAKPDTYKVEAFRITVHPWWEFKEPSEKWCSLNKYGDIWWSNLGYFTDLPLLEVFESEKEAKQWIDDRLEYLNKESKVVYES